MMIVITHSITTDEINLVRLKVAWSLKPSDQCRTDIRSELELDRAVGLLLDDNCTVANVRAGDHVTDLDFNQIAAAQLTVDCEIEGRFVSQSPFAVQVKADCPNLLLGKWPFGANVLTGVPGRMGLHREVKSRVSDGSSPRPKLAEEETLGIEASGPIVDGPLAAMRTSKADVLVCSVLGAESQKNRRALSSAPARLPGGRLP